MWALSQLGDSAGLVIDTIAQSPQSVRENDRIVAARVGASRPDVAATLALLHDCGWVIVGTGGKRDLAASPDALRALGGRLRGFVEGRRAAEKRAGVVTPIVTLPQTSTVLRDSLGVNDASYGTRDGFAYVTGRATERVVFLIPFMDQVGADLVVSLARTSNAHRRFLVTRPDSKGNRFYARHVASLVAAGVEVMEYWHPRPEGSQPAAETFHAKLVLGDDDLVYVGSSNLMASSLEGGLECGVILEGKFAKPFRDIIDGVLRSSTAFHG